MRHRQAASLAARVVVSAAILAVLLLKVPDFRVGDLVPRWTAGTAAWLAAAAVLTLAGLVLSAVRWQRVLQALDVRERLPRLVSHTLAGQFVSNVLPTTIGGDVLRVSRLSRDTGETPRTFVHLGVNELRTHPAAALDVLVAGFAYQLTLVLAAVAAAQALGLQAAGLTALLAFFPAVLIAQVLPISLAGLGVREGAFVLFLGPLGVAKEEAIALGLLLYLLNVALGLLGAPAFAAGGRTRRPVAA